MKVCGEPGCPDLTDGSRCEQHQRPAWAGRNGTTSRQQRGITRTGWQEQAEHRAILRAEPRCRRCGAPATQVDHIIPRAEGGPDTRTNKQPLCGDCHKTKTATEAARARTTPRG